MLAVADLALALGPGRHHRDQHHDLPGRAALAAGAVEAIGAGGLSGRPLTERALEVLRMLRDRVGPT